MRNIKLNEFTSEELQWLFNTVRDKGANELLSDEDTVTCALWLTQIREAIEERNEFELIGKN